MLHLNGFIHKPLKFLSKSLTPNFTLQMLQLNGNSFVLWLWIYSQSNSIVKEPQEIGRRAFQNANFWNIHCSLIHCLKRFTVNIFFLVIVSYGLKIVPREAKKVQILAHFEWPPWVELFTIYVIELHEFKYLQPFPNHSILRGYLVKLQKHSMRHL